MEFGAIELILGPMFAGKSTELQRRMGRHQIAGKKTLMINYSKDTRYGDPSEASTHDGRKVHAVALGGKLMETALQIAFQVDIICIDEGQFFPDIDIFATYLANNGKVVIIAALDGTYEQKQFEPIVALLPHCEKVKKLRAVCMDCKSRPAAFTVRITNSTEIELIGGADEYQAVCRACLGERNIAKNLAQWTKTKNYSTVETRPHTVTVEREIRGFVLPPGEPKSFLATFHPTAIKQAFGSSSSE